MTMNHEQTPARPLKLRLKKVLREIERVPRTRVVETHRNPFFFSEREKLEIESMRFMLPRDKNPVEGGGT